MAGAPGVEIESVRPGSPLYLAGVRPGDRLVSVNGATVRDALDYSFLKDGSSLEMQFRDAGRIEIHPPDSDDPGIGLAQFDIKKCGNNCVFCFVSQLPKGLRRSLYIKDEDFRMSFVYGNYITLANLSPEDRKRIVTQRLSPLYISVHSTERKVRNLLLGNPGAPDVMKDLRFFAKNGIRMHTQIVLCPGYNGGKHLQRTLRNLASLFPAVESVAVVPVGLTEHRRKKLDPVQAADAQAAISIIDSFHNRFRQQTDCGVVYAADELYIKAGQPVPPIDYYDDLPQIENGVGLVARFMEDAKRARAKKISQKKYLTFTGISFYSYLEAYVSRLIKRGHKITLLPVENRFFGPSVTVTGLLTGLDVISALSGKTAGHDILLVPDCATREGDGLFLDGMSAKDIECALGIKTLVIESTPKGLLKGLSS